MLLWRDVIWASGAMRWGNAQYAIRWVLRDCIRFKSERRKNEHLKSNRLELIIDYTALQSIIEIYSEL